MKRKGLAQRVRATTARPPASEVRYHGNDFLSRILLSYRVLLDRKAALSQDSGGEAPVTLFCHLGGACSFLLLPAILQQ